MKTANAVFTFLILAMSWPASSVAANAPPTLSHNPFSRPSSAVIRPQRSAVEQSDAAVPTLPLQATMIGSVNRLANVGGRILKAGDDYEGYQLIAIHERHAVFERDGRKMTVYVKPQPADDADDRR